MNGADTGKVIKINLPSMSLGRESSTDICLNDKSVSRKHCLIVSSSSSIILIDLQSSNGTMINEKRVERDQLKNGDKIRVGQTILRFEIADLEVSEYHEKLYQRITFDDLTSLYNRKSMLRELNLRFAAVPKSLPFSLLFMDIDYFKRVNDCHGHMTGSKILAELGRLLLSNLRSVDLACRYGGEEFVLIISQSRSEEAVFVAEKLREMIKNQMFVSEKGDKISITVSIGIVEATIGPGGYRELISYADEAMYQAKNAGRDRSVLYKAGDPPKFIHISG
jgi:diguanylate cyclase (GGDEF)-like protein